MAYTDENSFFITYNDDIVGALKKNGIDKYIILNEQLAVIYLPKKYNPKLLNNIFEISWWQKSFPMSSLIEITDELQKGENVTVASGTEYIYNSPYNEASGKEVLVAIIDSGIDYLHPDFIYNEEKSKIISLWDQENETGSPPEGMLFGSEFSRDEISKAISENDKSLSTDEIGTGTIAAGIVSSLGNKNPRYKGVAIGSELIVVKLRKYKDTYYEGRINYEFSDFLAAIAYSISIARKEKKLLIVNLTIGSRSSSFTEVNILDTFKALKTPGIIFVSGAGNQGNTDIHYAGKFNGSEKFQDIIIQDDGDKNLDIVLTGKGPDKIGAQLISPSGEVSLKALYSPDYYVYKGKFNLEGTTYSMRFIYPYITSGSEQLEIELRDIKPGVWTLRLIPEFIINGEYDVYLPNKNLIGRNTRFLDPESISTITKYATGKDLITIGAYSDKTNSIWIGSSKGSNEEKCIKPDIVAPGVDIISTYINSTYNTATGTGVSSSIVSGALALIMEYLVNESEIPRISLFDEVLKTYLMLGATKNSIYIYPNNFQGYGVLNLKNTIQEIADNL